MEVGIRFVCDAGQRTRRLCDGVGGMQRALSGAFVIFGGTVGGGLMGGWVSLEHSGW
jgi:hypothetical protein